MGSLEPADHDPGEAAQRHVRSDGNAHTAAGQRRGGRREHCGAGQGCCSERGDEGTDGAGRDSHPSGRRHCRSKDRTHNAEVPGREKRQLYRRSCDRADCERGGGNDDGVGGHRPDGPAVEHDLHAEQLEPGADGNRQRVGGPGLRGRRRDPRARGERRGLRLGGGA